MEISLKLLIDCPDNQDCENGTGIESDCGEERAIAAIAEIGAEGLPVACVAGCAHSACVALCTAIQGEFLISFQAGLLVEARNEDVRLWMHPYVAILRIKPFRWTESVRGAIVTLSRFCEFFQGIFTFGAVNARIFFSVLFADSALSCCKTVNFRLCAI